MPDRLPSPGPSFLREQEVVVHGRRMRAGMTRPSQDADGWWLTLLWVEDELGLVTFRDVAPVGGPPPDPPAARLGPMLAGSLSGLILEESGRLQFRLALATPPPDSRRPWEAALAVLTGIRWEPLRQSTMRPNELAEAVLSGFRRSVEGLARP